MLWGSKTETSLYDLFEQVHLLVRNVVANRISNRQNQVGATSDKHDPSEVFTSYGTIERMCMTKK